MFETHSTYNPGMALSPCTWLPEVASMHVVPHLQYHHYEASNQKYQSQ